MQKQTQFLETKSRLEQVNLHKYVLICFSCLLVIVATFPLAYWRVSKKYGGEPFKSLSLEETQHSTPSVPK